MKESIKITKDGDVYDLIINNSSNQSELKISESQYDSLRIHFYNEAIEAVDKKTLITYIENKFKEDYSIKTNRDWQEAPYYTLGDRFEEIKDYIILYHMVEGKMLDGNIYAIIDWVKDKPTIDGAHYFLNEHQAHNEYFKRKKVLEKYGVSAEVTIAELKPLQ